VSRGDRVADDRVGGFTARGSEQRVWGDRYERERHYLHVYVRGLRKKLETDPTRPTKILTEPGVGYRWAGS
jgi:two-component system KDP operon response regulator KdpE